MSELKEELPSSPDNNEESPDSDAVESGAEEAKEKKEEKWIMYGDYKLRIKIPEEKKEEK